MTYTVQDIKRTHEENGGYFFTRETMQFFGDRMADFGVRNYPHTTYLIRKNHKRDAFANVWEFNPENGALKPLHTKATLGEVFEDMDRAGL